MGTVLPVQALDGEPDMDSTAIGDAVEARYKKLGLTQERLAWLAGVSNSTIRNVLHGRVSEARTWPRVAQALGWKRRSLDQLRAGEEPEEILSVDALRSLWAGATRLEEESGDSEAAESVIRMYDDLVLQIGLVDSGLRNEKHVRDVIERLWSVVVRRLSPDESEPLSEAFQDFGWRPKPEPELPKATQRKYKSQEIGRAHV